VSLSYLVCAVNKCNLQFCRVKPMVWIRPGMEAEWSCARSTPSCLAAAFPTVQPGRTVPHISGRDTGSLRICLGTLL